MIAAILVIFASMLMAFSIAASRAFFGARITFIPILVLAPFVSVAAFVGSIVLALAAIFLGPISATATALTIGLLLRDTQQERSHGTRGGIRYAQDRPHGTTETAHARPRRVLAMVGAAITVAVVILNLATGANL